MASKGIDISLKIVYSLLFAGLIISAAFASDEISAEKRVSYLGRPAVVMIISTYVGNLELDGEPVIGLFDDYDEIFEMVTIPSFSMSSMGSGFVVSSDGYIVTNAHVVQETEEEILAEFALQAADWATEELPAIFVSNGYEPYPATEEDYWDMYDVFLSCNLDYKREILVYFGAPSSLSRSPVGYPAEIRKISPQEFWYSSGDYKYRSGKDLAIIKIETSDELPTANLGDSNDVEVGDKAVVIGYPGATASWQNQLLSPETEYVPSVTSGIISAKKKLPDRSEAFQTDAAIYHGNSGGPAFNADGEVIGIATFGSGRTLVSGEWLDIQGYNFLIPINVAKSFISELNIDTTPSEATKAFERGFELYWNGSRSEARGEFDAILALDPNNQYAAEYSSMAQRR
ncbi:MAG TPA: trypsin-like peptidase domain-containing protein [Methanothrix sp.]|nr:trypsin-like peptidase domain-containing protein [Methanothrix sp.]HPR67112.1 trypsin-like peptidase domain-containing protein [Methanothrix sp.]